MKLKVVTGATIYESAKNVLSGIDKNDLLTPYFVVVPDRYTLQAEKLLFEVLGISSTFNINVVGLSSLASKIMGERERLSAIDGIILIKKILISLKENLRFFSKQTSALCEELYKTIAQMKSSGITPDKISENVKSQNLANKIHDIKIIFEEYEKQRGQRLDDDDLMILFAEEIQNKNLFKDSIFVFAGFDSFTATNFMILRALSKSAKEIHFALPKAESLSNAYIFEGDIFKKLSRLAKENDLNLEVVSPKSDLNENQYAIVSNAFGHSIAKKENNDFLYVISNNSIREEVLFVAKSIKKSVFDGARFNDFAIVCPDIEEYKLDIATILNSFNISYYIDASESLSETLLARFIKKCFDLNLKGYLKEDILYFLSSLLLDVDDRENLIAFVAEKNISGREKFEKYISHKNQFFKLCNFKDRTSYNEYAESVLKIIEFVKEKHLAFVENEEENGFAQKSSFESQSVQALQEVCESLSNFYEEIDLKDFVAILITALDAKEISSLPSFCDQVFVGDASKSFFSKTKNLFVLGANAGKVPVQSGDDGLLSDNEINSSCFSGILEPTIKMVNKRNRFKLFSILAQAENRLVISHLNFDEEGQKQEKAFILNNLMEIFDVSEKKIISSNNIVAKDVDSLLFSLGTEVYGKEELGKLLSEENQFAGSASTVFKFDKEKMHLNRKILSQDLTKNLLLKNDRVKVTQIEKYYDCPFKHFVANGLRPVEKKYAEVKPNEYGTIMHNLLEDFVKKFARKMNEINDEDIKRYIECNLNKFLEEEKLEFMPDENLFKKEVYLNALTLCKRAVYECKNSKFIPTYFEKKFDGQNLKLNDVNVVGVVDRVDVFDDAFRVIDYKTGKITSAILSSLYYGQKLQLFLYGNSLKNELGLDFVGAFYFDAKVSYSKNEKTILKGVYKPSEKVIFALDKRIEKGEKSSDIAKIERTKTGYARSVLNQPEMQTLEEYAKKIASIAIEQIEEGNIEPMPTNDSCQFCEYRSICLFDENKGFRSQKSRNSFFDKKEEE